MDRRWTDIDWDAPAPSDADIARSQKRLRFIPVAQIGPALARLRDEFRSVLTKGGALTATFDVQDADDAAHHMFTRNRFGPYEFNRLLLTSPAFLGTLPEMRPVDPTTLRWLPYPRPEPDDSFIETSPFLLDGQLAEALFEGGPYEKYEAPASEAKDLAVAATDELMGRRYEDFRVERTQEGWSRWFKDWMWSSTWIITDLRQHRTTVFSITDID